MIAATVCAALAAPAAGQVPRTPWGDPDLQGFWTNDAYQLVPFARPDRFGDRQTVTDAELAERIKQFEGRLDPRGTLWYESTPQKVPNRTSLIVDPPNGRLPPLTAAGQARLDARKADRERRAYPGMVSSLADTAADISLWSRCLTRSLPGAWIPRAYNNNRQILQVPGYVVIVYEEIHDVRVIPLDGRPHLGSAIRQWFGDSRGRWEGNTLVVEVTNLRNVANLAGTPILDDDLPVSDRARIVERFTRVDANTIDFQTTFEDPETFTRPVTVSIPMVIDPSHTQVMEYACHEGNRSLEVMLGGARAIDREKEQERRR